MAPRRFNEYRWYNLRQASDPLHLMKELTEIILDGLIPSTEEYLQADLDCAGDDKCGTDWASTPFRGSFSRSDSYHQLADDDPYWTKTKVDLDAIYIYDSDEDLSMYDDPPDLSRFDDPPGDLSPLFDLPSSLSSPRPSSPPNHPTREGLLDWQFRQGLLSYSHLIVPPDNTHPSQTSSLQGLSHPKKKIPWWFSLFQWSEEFTWLSIMVRFHWERCLVN